MRKPYFIFLGALMTVMLMFSSLVQSVYSDDEEATEQQRHKRTCEQRTNNKRVHRAQPADMTTWNAPTVARASMERDEPPPLTRTVANAHQSLVADTQRCPAEDALLQMLNAYREGSLHQVASSFRQFLNNSCTRKTDLIRQHMRDPEELFLLARYTMSRREISDCCLEQAANLKHERALQELFKSALFGYKKAVDWFNQRLLALDYMPIEQYYIGRLMIAGKFSQQTTPDVVEGYQWIKDAVLGQNKEALDYVETQAQAGSKEAESILHHVLGIDYSADQMMQSPLSQSSTSS